MVDHNILPDLQAWQDAFTRIVKQDERIECLREITNIRLEAVAKALEIQAAEYLRRLDDLNHENERVETAQNKSVSRDIYDAGHRDHDNKMNAITKELHLKVDGIDEKTCEKITILQRFMNLSIGGLIVIEVALQIITWAVIHYK